MKIKVLLVIPGMEVQKVKIPASIKFIKSFIGDDLQKYKLGENNILIANKNPKIDEFNRFYRNNMILGRFIIVSTKKDYQVKDAIVVHSIEELLEELKKYDTNDVYIIGGDSIYKQMLPYCDTANVTKIDRAYEADTYFPNLDEMDDWEITADSDEQVYFDLTYHFLKYERKK